MGTASPTRYQYIDDSGKSAPCATTIPKQPEQANKIPATRRESGCSTRMNIAKTMVKTGGKAYKVEVKPAPSVPTRKNAKAFGRAIPVALLNKQNFRKRLSNCIKISLPETRRRRMPAPNVCQKANATGDSPAEVTCLASGSIRASKPPLNSSNKILIVEGFKLVSLDIF